MEPTTVTLSELATGRPGATAIFRDLGLDFCCGGNRSLADACRDRGLDPDDVLARLGAEASAAEDDPSRWAGADVPSLIRHIVDHYHARLRRDLPRLIEMARKVERRHADKPAVPGGLAEHLLAMAGDLEHHMQKEEQVLFPMLLAGNGAVAGGPIAVMEREHADAGRELARTRELTGDLTPPDEACTTWRALYVELARLEADLTDHIHLENNVLFPRATAA